MKFDLKNSNALFSLLQENRMNQKSIPDSTALRVALWRALHLEVDSPPSILEDAIGLKLADPDANWRNRPDMHPEGTSRFRASIVARARFVEDLVAQELKTGTGQYVILGAGLDTFAQRCGNPGLHLFEVDQPETQQWKRKRLEEIGFPPPAWLHFVPLNFETDFSLWDALGKAGFKREKPAVVSSLGVSMYLGQEAVRANLREMAKLGLGSKFVMTFMLPIELVDAQDRPGYEMAIKGARASGTPFLSFFRPQEMLEMAKNSGFREVEHLSTASLTPRYFSGRSDGLYPSTGEEILVAST